MSELVSLLITAGLLIGVLALMVRGARGGKGPARTCSALNDYDLEHQPWGVALLVGLALGEIARARGGGINDIGAVALLVGVWCGVSKKPSKVRNWTTGLIGVVASIIGSATFVADAHTTLDQFMRGLVVGLLGLLFGMFAIARRKPLQGLTWFAALDIAVFCTGPLGQSWFEGGGWEGATIALVGFVVAIVLAFMPDFVIELFAFAALVAQIGLTGTGYLPGNLMHSTGPVAITFVGYALALFLRGKVRGRSQT